jgi:hypothetical protein
VELRSTPDTDPYSLQQLKSPGIVRGFFCLTRSAALSTVIKNWSSLNSRDVSSARRRPRIPTRRSTSFDVKVFATTDAAEKWFEENDPEGVAFEYEVLE